MIEIFLLNFFGRSKCMTKWQFLLIFLKRVDKDPFLRLQVRDQEDFNRHQFFQQISNTEGLHKCKIRQIIGVFFGKYEILVTL